MRARAILDPVRRPNPLLWLAYQFTGRLPARYRDWVLHDGICRTWLLRVFLRGFVQMLPVLAVLFVFFAVVLGGPLLLAFGSILLALLVGFRFVLAYSVESVDHRLAKNGHPPGYGTTMRKARYKAEHTDEDEDYDRVWRTPGR